MKKKTLRLMLTVIGILLILFGTVGYLPDIISEYKGEAEFEEMRKEFTSDAPDPLEEENQEEEREEEDAKIKQYLLDYPCIDVDSEKLLKKNADYIGWIYVPDTDISYPVCKSDDNNYYLHTNFDGNYQYSGTVFMDCRNESPSDAHSILYAHNMRNGSMFNQIKKYLQVEFIDEHPVFWFITKDNEKMLFEVFSTLSVKAKEEHIYKIYIDDDSEEYEEMIHFMYMNAVQPKYPEEHTIMTLSTCMSNNKYRCAVSGSLLGTY